MPITNAHRRRAKALVPVERRPLQTASHWTLPALTPPVDGSLTAREQPYHPLADRYAGWTPE